MNARHLAPHARSRRHAATLAAAPLCLMVAACAGTNRGSAVPDNLADQAVVFGMPEIRSWGTPLSRPFVDEITKVAMREVDRARRTDGSLSPVNFLAISGGGCDGAFGAGLMNGWSDAGTRPEFKLVTGISTGALSAPFAFLGQKYDKQLREVYTTVTTQEIMRPRGVLALLLSDSMADTEPLRGLVKKLVTVEMMKDIATEYERGRILLIGTTNLDSLRGVIWNVGALAASGHPGALDLIHKIMVGSAAIPAAFPPVMVDVSINGKAYQEMHVDGGTRAQVFLYPPSYTGIQTSGIHRERHAYIIRNSRVDPQWAETRPRVMPIASRAIASLIQTQGVGDLYKLYVTAQRDGVDYNLAAIPQDFKMEYKEEFDPVYMKALYDVGYKMARNGYPWAKQPPGYTD